MSSRDLLELSNIDLRGLNDISKQTMANWAMRLSEKCFSPLYDRMKTELLTHPVNQADETPVLVIKDGRPTATKSWMWVHRTGEFYRGRQLVLYEYQKTRNHAALAASDQGWRTYKNEPKYFIKCMLGEILACYKEFEKRITITEKAGRISRSTLL